MFKRLFISLTVLYCIAFQQAAFADSTRVNQSPDYPARRLAKQFNSNADSFYNGDPNTGNLTTTSATGRVPRDGLVTVAVTTITEPMTLTIWWWSKEESKWVHMGAAAADYSKAFDADYTSAQFAVPPDAAYILTAVEAVTGNVYVSGRAHKDNANSAEGYDQ